QPGRVLRSGRRSRRFKSSHPDQSFQASRAAREPPGVVRVRPKCVARCSVDNGTVNIDWAHFTPWSSLAGGALIGVSAALFILFNGRIAGISGILGGLLRPPASNSDAARFERSWRALFL